MPMFKQNLKELELPDLPDFKAKEKVPISKPIEKKKYGDVEKPKSVKKVPKEKKLPDKTKKSTSKWNMLKHFGISKKEKINKTKMLESKIKEIDTLLSKKNGKIIKNQTQIKKPTESPVSTKEAIINEKGAKSFLKKEKKIERKNEFLEKSIDDNKKIKEELLSKERLVSNEDNELRRKEQELLKKENLLEKKEKKFVSRKKELEELKEKQKNLQRDKEILEKKVKSFLKKEKKIERKNEFIDGLIKENNEIKDNLSSKEKLVGDKENELRRKEQELLKKENLLEKNEEKKEESDVMKKELDKLKIKQGDIERKKEILEKEAELFLKKEQRIKKESELLEILVNENKKIKGNLLSKEKLLVDRENELRIKEQELLKKESLSEERDVIKPQISLPNKIEKSTEDSIKNEALKEIEKTKDIIRKDTYSTGKGIKDYPKINDASIVERNNPALNILPNNFFTLIDGQVIKNLSELANFLRIMPDEVFGYHVNFQKNDFSDWIRDVIKEDKLANDIAKSESKQDMARLIETRISKIKEGFNLKEKKTRISKIKKKVNLKEKTVQETLDKHLNKKDSKKAKRNISLSKKIKKPIKKLTKKIQKKQRPSVLKKQKTPMKRKTTKKIGKDEMGVMIKDVNYSIAGGNISEAISVLSKVKKAYKNLSKKDKASLRYDILDLETDIKLASLNT